MKVGETVWISPLKIAFKVSTELDLRGVVGGDWDVTRRFLLADTAKHRSMFQRFVEGMRWEETEIFKSQYDQRFSFGGTVRGAKNIRELAAQYYDRVDGLFQSLKRDGFRTKIDGAEVRLPNVLIARTGETLLGNQGNHRVAMAKILGMKQIACKVQCTHKAWRC
jgi:hypothetical protein